jgi:hypothetical protein
VRINGTGNAQADELLAHLRLLWLTPSMDGLFTGCCGRSAPVSRPAGFVGRSRPWQPGAKL